MIRGTTLVPAPLGRVPGTTRRFLGEVSEDRRKEARADLRAALELALEERARKQAAKTQQEALEQAIAAGERAGEGRQAILESGQVNLDQVLRNTGKIAGGAFVLYAFVSLIGAMRKPKPATARKNPRRRRNAQPWCEEPLGRLMGDIDALDLPPGTLDLGHVTRAARTAGVEL